MKTNLPELRRQRDHILAEIQAIDRLRRGTLSEQFFVQQRAGKTVRQGPYYVLQCYLKGAKCSQRIAPEAAAQARIDVANYQRFQQLAEQFIHITDQLTRSESTPADAKKNSTRRKSPRSSSPNPGPS